MSLADLASYEFTSLEEIREFIAVCPDNIRPILWALHLSTLDLANEEPKYVH